MQYPGLDPEIGKKDISGKTGEIQTMSLCNDKNPISLDLHFIPLTKQPNDLFTFYTFTAGTSISFFFPQLFLSLFLVSFSSIFQF